MINGFINIWMDGFCESTVCSRQVHSGAPPRMKSVVKSDPSVHQYTGKTMSNIWFYSCCCYCMYCICWWYDKILMSINWTPNTYSKRHTDLDTYCTLTTDTHIYIPHPARPVFMKLPACLSVPQPRQMIFFECCNYHVTPCCHYSDCRRPW